MGTSRNRCRSTSVSSLVAYGGAETMTSGRDFRIVLAEDDHAISQPLAGALRREGYDVAICGDGLSALAAAPDYDLLLLDLGLPELDGLDVCRQLRAAGHALPIMIVSGRSEEVDTVVGLDAGADDYLTKPFRLAELMARVRALLRRVSIAPAPQTGRVRVDLEGRRAYLDETELTLSVKEFNLLSVLVRESGRVVSRAELMREIWDTEWFGSTKTLDMHVSWLRRKLGEAAGGQRFIVTVRGVGFRFEPQG
jgi:DNA-binding response OmpR family regulator